MNDQVIWLASYPRSGNTLARQLIHKVTKWPTFSLYKDPALSDAAKEAIGNIPLLRDHWMLPEWEPRDPPPHPMFIKTHEKPIPGDYRRAVVIVRDGRDVCASYARYLKDRWRWPSKDLLEMVIRGMVLRKRWDNHVSSWLDYQNDWMLIRYEDLLEEPGLINEIIAFALDEPVDGRPVSLPRIDESKKLDPKFYHRGGSWWREVFTDELHDLFWRLHGDTMEKLGYER